MKRDDVGYDFDGSKLTTFSHFNSSTTLNSANMSNHAAVDAHGIDNKYEKAKIVSPSSAIKLANFLKHTAMSTHINGSRTQLAT